MIVRASKEPELYYKLDHKIARDKRLGWAARGVLIYLLTRPNNWECSVQNLCNEVAESGSKTGRDATYKIINQLIEVGYMLRIQPRLKNGTVGEQILIVGESRELVEAQKKAMQNNPVPDKPEAEAEPITDLPDTDQPDTVKPTQRTNDFKEQTNSKKKREQKQTGPEQWEARGKARSTSSALYERFLELYRVSPSNKARCREEWFRERLDWGYSCEAIGQRIIEALEIQHATCYRFRLAKFVPKPEDYLRQEQWTDKIVPLKEQPKKTASAAPDRSGALAMIRNKSRQSRTIEGELSS